MIYVIARPVCHFERSRALVRSVRRAVSLAALIAGLTASAVTAAGQVTVASACSRRLPTWRKVSRMAKPLTGAVYAAAMAAVVVGVDVLLFRGHFWERLAANVGIVLLSVAFYFRFLHRA